MLLCIEIFACFGCAKELLLRPIIFCAKELLLRAAISKEMPPRAKKPLKMFFIRFDLGQASVEAYVLS